MHNGWIGPAVYCCGTGSEIYCTLRYWCCNGTPGLPKLPKRYGQCGQCGLPGNPSPLHHRNFERPPLRTSWRRMCKAPCHADPQPYVTSGVKHDSCLEDTGLRTFCPEPSDKNPRTINVESSKGIRGKPLQPDIKRASWVHLKGRRISEAETTSVPGDADSPRVGLCGQRFGQRLASPAWRAETDPIAALPSLLGCWGAEPQLGLHLATWILVLTVRRWHFRRASVLAFLVPEIPLVCCGGNLTAADMPLL